MSEHKTQLLSTVIIVAIVTLGIGFFSGVKYQQSKAPSQNPFTRGAGAMNGQRAGFAGGARRTGDIANGEIISKDDKSMTIKLRDGGSKIIFFSSTTEIGKMAKGTLDDLAVGTNVMASGKSGTDGSLTADTIQIRPVLPTSIAPVIK